MKHLSRTTCNMARKRGLVLVEQTDDTGEAVVEICQLEDGEASDEYIAAYRYTDAGFWFIASCDVHDNDLPQWIQDEQSLRILLNDFALLYKGE